MASSTLSSVVVALLVVLLWCNGGEALPMPLFEQLLAAFDPAGVVNGTSLLEQFFSSHAQHSLASFGELGDIAQTFFSGK